MALLGENALNIIFLHLNLCVCWLGPVAEGLPSMQTTRIRFSAEQLEVFFFLVAFYPFIFSAGPLLNSTQVIDLHKDINCTHDGFKHDWILLVYTITGRPDVLYFINLDSGCRLNKKLMYQEFLSIRACLAGIHHFIVLVGRFSFKVARYAMSPWVLQNFHSNESA